MAVQDSDFLRACRGQPVQRTPIWFMRQAGRSLPEYRELRREGNILDAIQDPELAAEITLQPIRRYGVDAAILFSDIVVPIAAIGFGVEIVAGRGPVIAEPFRSLLTWTDFGRSTPERDTPYVIETVQRLVGELEVPLIGFAGGPFTVGSYLVEGGPSRDFVHTKRLMHTDPETFARLLDRLADLAIQSLLSQVAAGASAIQLFDSWAGALSRADYEHYVLPATTKVLHALTDSGVPRIHFGVHTGEILDLVAGAGAEVVGVDWRTPLTTAAERVGPGVALQGNLDPALCLAGYEAVEPAARRILTEGATLDGHIFNLGHGVLPETDPSVLERLVELVHREGRAPMTTAVLVMAYGTPSSPETVEAYYTDIRRGRPPTPEQLADLVRRYDAIGGISPLNERTAEQVAALQHFLDVHAPGAFRTLYGAKHVDPKIESAVERALDAGHERVVGLVLAPHYSALSVGEYIERAEAVCAARGVPSAFLRSWHDEPALIEALASRVEAALNQLPEAARAGATVCFTAHSLPSRILELDDPYPRELQATADAVATRCGLATYRTGWQSAGRTGESWLGPDVVEIVEDLARSGSPGVVVCPAGFTSDHLEVLYDLDILAVERARLAGIPFARTASINAEPAVFEALAARVVALDTSLAGGSPPA